MAIVNANYNLKKCPHLLRAEKQPTKMLWCWVEMANTNTALDQMLAGAGQELVNFDLRTLTEFLLNPISISVLLIVASTLSPPSPPQSLVPIQN